MIVVNSSLCCWHVFCHCSCASKLNDFLNWQSMYINCVLSDIQDNEKVSVNLMITIQKSGAQRLFDHPVFLKFHVKQFRTFHNPHTFRNPTSHAPK